MPLAFSDRAFVCFRSLNASRPVGIMVTTARAGVKRPRTSCPRSILTHSPPLSFRRTVLASHFLLPYGWLHWNGDLVSLHYCPPRPFGLTTCTVRRATAWHSPVGRELTRLCWTRVLARADMRALTTLGRCCRIASFLSSAPPPFPHTPIRS